MLKNHDSKVDPYTGTSKKKLDYHEKCQYFCHSFQKVKPIYYIDSLHRVKYYKPLVLDILMIMAYRLWNVQIMAYRRLTVSQKFFILYKINKMTILNRNVRLLKSMFISMHSILGRASFCMNYCINAAWHEDNQLVALLRCNEDQVALLVAFRSSALLVLVSLIFLSTIPHRFSLGFRSGKFAGQSSTVTPWPLNQLLVTSAVWAGAKSCWKMKSASP